MTSDAKIGLLLGLFFIFVIAFIINGLPRFRSDTNSNELTTMANSDNDSYIGSNARKAQAAFSQEMPLRARTTSTEEAQDPLKEEVKVRYKRPLSGIDETAKREPITATLEDKVKPTVPTPDVNNETKTAMEAKFHDHKKFIESILATIPEGVLVIDKNDRILLANDAFFRIFHITKKAIGNKHLNDIIPQEKLYNFYLATLLGPKKNNPLEFRYQVKDQEKIISCDIFKME